MLNLMIGGLAGMFIYQFIKGRNKGVGTGTKGGKTGTPGKD